MNRFQQFTVGDSDADSDSFVTPREVNKLVPNLSSASMVHSNPEGVTPSLPHSPASAVACDETPASGVGAIAEKVSTPAEAFHASQPSIRIHESDADEKASISESHEGKNPNNRDPGKSRSHLSSLLPSPTAEMTNDPPRREGSASQVQWVNVNNRSMEEENGGKMEEPQAGTDTHMAAPPTAVTLGKSAGKSSEGNSLSQDPSGQGREFVSHDDGRRGPAEVTSGENTVGKDDPPPTTNQTASMAPPPQPPVVPAGEPKVSKSFCSCFGGESRAEREEALMQEAVERARAQAQAQAQAQVQASGSIAPALNTASPETGMTAVPQRKEQDIVIASKDKKLCRNETASGLAPSGSHANMKPPHDARPLHSTRSVSSQPVTADRGDREHEASYQDNEASVTIGSSSADGVSVASSEANVLGSRAVDSRSFHHPQDSETRKAKGRPHCGGRESAASTARNNPTRAKAPKLEDHSGTGSGGVSSSSSSASEFTVETDIEEEGAGEEKNDERTLPGRNRNRDRNCPRGATGGWKEGKTKRKVHQKKRCGHWQKDKARKMEEENTSEKSSKCSSTSSSRAPSPSESEVERRRRYLERRRRQEDEELIYLTAYQRRLLLDKRARQRQDEEALLRSDAWRELVFQSRSHRHRRHARVEKSNEDEEEDSDSVDGPRTKQIKDRESLDAIFDRLYMHRTGHLSNTTYHAPGSYTFTPSINPAPHRYGKSKHQGYVVERLCRSSSPRYPCSARRESQSTTNAQSHNQSYMSQSSRTRMGRLPSSLSSGSVHTPPPSMSYEARSSVQRYSPVARRGGTYPPPWIPSGAVRHVPYGDVRRNDDDFAELDEIHHRPLQRSSKHLAAARVPFGKKQEEEVCPSCRQPCKKTAFSRVAKNPSGVVQLV